MDLQFAIYRVTHSIHSPRWRWSTFRHCRNQLMRDMLCDCKRSTHKLLDILQAQGGGNHPSPTPIPFVPFCTPRRNGSAIRHLPSHTPFILLAGDGVLSGTEGINWCAICSVAANVPPTSYWTYYKHKEVCWMPSFGSLLLQHNVNHLRYAAVPLHAQRRKKEDAAGRKVAQRIEREEWRRHHR